jgi:hypothetical protein
MYRADSCEQVKRERDTLRYEVEDYRERYERKIEEEQEAKEEHRRQFKRQAQERLAEVDNWPEAFRLGIPLIVKEAQSEEFDNRKYGDDPEWKQTRFFKEWLAQVHRARDIYNEIMVDIERQIAELRKKGLADVAERLDAEYGETETAQAFRDNRPDFLTYW